MALMTIRYDPCERFGRADDDDLWPFCTYCGHDEAAHGKAFYREQ